MKVISLLRALGTASLVLVAVCATANDAYRETSVRETTAVIKHWNDRICDTSAAPHSLNQISRIADNIRRYERGDELSGNPLYTADYPILVTKYSSPTPTARYLVSRTATDYARWNAGRKLLNTGYFARPESTTN